MEFEYDKPEEDPRECIAFLTHMEDSPDKPILCIRNTGHREPQSKQGALWLYYDGSTHLYKWEPELATQKFYKGDTVTITF